MEDCVLLYTNIGTITNKMNELKAKIVESKAKIVALVESHPKVFRYKLSESEIQIRNFQLFTNLDCGGRGVCLHIHNSLTSSCLHTCINAIKLN